MVKEELTFSNIRTCPYCNSQNVRTEYELKTNTYIIHCMGCKRTGKEKGE